MLELFIEYDINNNFKVWSDNIFRFVKKVTSSPAFPAVITLILFSIMCWAISYFTKK